ncbi:hypothetical protein [Aquimarina sp. I32.4]|uniref:hypothetical protein n=1 Tax=Aquimarina sp. I32.4 TaxID=2053903 RepID=UPI000CDE5CFC|nr:hypothetical protein [Aquimarina sp. I32.4]
MQLIKLLGYIFISSFILIGCSDDDNTITNSVLQASNRQPLGSSANDLLSDTNYNSLTIEIVAVQGFEPTRDAIEGFRDFLQDRLFKPNGITITQRSIPSSGKAPFAIEEIAEIENTNRTLFNKEDDITVYIYFADGRREADTSEQVTLGSAYLNTSIVIYKETLLQLSTRTGSPALSAIETATLNHEFAHLMGLVNLGTPLQSQHEDSEEHNHCNVSGCLMESAIKFGMGMMSIGDMIPQLDSQCIADLRANGGK